MKEMARAISLLFLFALIIVASAFLTLWTISYSGGVMKETSQSFTVPISLEGVGKDYVILKNAVDHEVEVDVLVDGVKCASAIIKGGERKKVGLDCEITADSQLVVLGKGFMLIR